MLQLIPAPRPNLQPDDLELLTAVGLQAAVVLDNVALHAERLREERLIQEVALARDIQQSFLPADFGGFAGNDPELFAWVNPALEMSGDLYDFIRLPGGRLAFFLGDVSGKGMPAALFMVAVRTLLRDPGAVGRRARRPAARLHAALAVDNPTDRYVTLVHGVYDPADGSVVLAVAGHPPPLLRRASGSVEPVAVPRSVFLGCSTLTVHINDSRLVLGRGETLIAYSDGYTEAFTADRKCSAWKGCARRWSARTADDAPPYGASAEERGSLGTLSWQRVVKVAGLAAAVAALTATSIAAGHMVRAVGPPTRAHGTSVISIQRGPVPVGLRPTFVHDAATGAIASRGACLLTFPHSRGRFTGLLGVAERCVPFHHRRGAARGDFTGLRLDPVREGQHVSARARLTSARLRGLSVSEWAAVMSRPRSDGGTPSVIAAMSSYTASAA